MQRHDAALARTGRAWGTIAAPNGSKKPRPLLQTSDVKHQSRKLGEMNPEQRRYCISFAETHSRNNHVHQIREINPSENELDEGKGVVVVFYGQPLQLRSNKLEESSTTLVAIPTVQANIL